VYVWFVVGFTVVLAATDPVLQVYVLAPLAVNVPTLPLQIAMADELIVGKEFTVTVAIAVFVQVFASVPVTV
jgi:hypothetical protein